MPGNSTRRLARRTGFVGACRYDRHGPGRHAPLAPLTPAPDAHPRRDRPLAREPREHQSVAYSTCYMCACRCGIKVTLENGQIHFIQGNPEHPVNHGVLCAKGSAARRALTG